MRCFIAIPVDEQVKLKISSFERQLILAGASVKWVDPENFHFTLKFLGEIDGETVLKSKSALDESCRGHNPFTISIAGVGFFPDFSRPRVVWIGIGKGRAELAKLWESVERSFVKLGFAPEAHGFSPHLTLGRIKDSRGVGRLVSTVKDSHAAEFGTMEVKEVHLMESILRREGPIYRKIYEVSLGRRDDLGS